jgi:hypothetical protein
MNMVKGDFHSVSLAPNALLHGPWVRALTKKWGRLRTNGEVVAYFFAFFLSLGSSKPTIG